MYPRLQRLTAALLLAGAAAAAGEVIVNGDFQTATNAPSLAGWTVGGTANARRATNTINTSGGNAGFESFFGTARTNSFAVLGDASGAIGGTPNSGTHSIAQTFVLPGVVDGSAVATFDLVVGFRTAFDGRDDGSVPDAFSAWLGDILLFRQESTVFPSGVPSTSSANVQLVHDPFSAALLGLAPGEYTLRFELPRVFLPKPKYSVTGPDGVEASFDWRAAFDDGEGIMLRVHLLNDIASYC